MDLKSAYFPTVGYKSVKRHYKQQQQQQQNMIGTLELYFTSSSTNILPLFSK